MVPPRRPAHWLMKSEPDEYSIEDLERAGTGTWEGVRNFQARNHLRSMCIGDHVLFYHSNAKPPGVVGVAEVTRTAYPDPSQFDRKSPYHDPRSPPDAPRWSMVEVRFVERLPRMVSLDELKADPALSTMLVVRRGMRLSVQPVEPQHYRRVLALARQRKP
jgi:predicted RNA-binding protein with PUA-like domain